MSWGDWGKKLSIPQMQKLIEKVVDKLVETTKRDVEFQPEDTIPVSRPIVKPFEDRYVKEEPAKFISKEIIKEGLDVIKVISQVSSEANFKN